MVKSKKGNHLVVKSNNLIEASYRLTAGEQKVIMTLVSQINPDDKEFKVYHFKIQEFKKLLDIKSNSIYNDVKEITKDLLKKAFTIKDNNRIIQLSWLSSAEYIEGTGVVELCFDPKLKPFLLQLKERLDLTGYNLSAPIQFKSGYSIRFYELLKQYEAIGVRIITLDELKYYLGIGEDEYKLYHQLKQRVIQVAEKELRQKKSDIYFTFDELKEGKRVTKIKFTILHTDKFQASSESVISDVAINYIVNTFTTLADGQVLEFEKVKSLIEHKGIEKVNLYLNNWNKLKPLNPKNQPQLFCDAVMNEYSIEIEVPLKKTRRKKKDTEFTQETFDNIK